MAANYSEVILGCVAQFGRVLRNTGRCITFKVPEKSAGFYESAASELTKDPLSLRASSTSILTDTFLDTITSRGFTACTHAVRQSPHSLKRKQRGQHDSWERAREKLKAIYGCPCALCRGIYVNNPKTFLPSTGESPCIPAIPVILRHNAIAHPFAATSLAPQPLQSAAASRNKPKILQSEQ